MHCYKMPVVCLKPTLIYSRCPQVLLKYYTFVNYFMTGVIQWWSTMCASERARNTLDQLLVWGQIIEPTLQQTDL